MRERDAELLQQARRDLEDAREALALVVEAAGGEVRVQHRSIAEQPKPTLAIVDDFESYETVYRTRRGR